MGSGFAKPETNRECVWQILSLYEMFRVTITTVWSAGLSDEWTKITVFNMNQVRFCVCTNTHEKCAHTHSRKTTIAWLSVRVFLDMFMCTMFVECIPPQSTSVWCAIQTHVRLVIMGTKAPINPHRPASNRCFCSARSTLNVKIKTHSTSMQTRKKKTSLRMKLQQCDKFNIDANRMALIMRIETDLITLDTSRELIVCMSWFDIKASTHHQHCANRPHVVYVCVCVWLRPHQPTTAGVIHSDVCVFARSDYVRPVGCWSSGQPAHSESFSMSPTKRRSEAHTHNNCMYSGSNMNHSTCCAAGVHAHFDNRCGRYSRKYPDCIHTTSCVDFSKSCMLLSSAFQ